MTTEKKGVNDVILFEFVKFVSAHSLDTIRLADTKAATLITLLSANLLILVQRGGTLLAQPQLTNHFGLWCLLAATICVLISLGCAINIIRSRIQEKPEPGLVYWADVHTREIGDYQNKFLNLSNEDITHELSSHNYVLASIAARKYWWVRLSFLLTFFSIALSAVVILLTGAPQ
jgi:hypothetical protein